MRDYYWHLDILLLSLLDAILPNCLNLYGVWMSASGSNWQDVFFMYLCYLEALKLQLLLVIESWHLLVLLIFSKLPHNMEMVPTYSLTTSLTDSAPYNFAFGSQIDSTSAYISSFFLSIFDRGASPFVKHVSIYIILSFSHVDNF